MRRPLFLARSPYRRRRLRDAARLLPVAGLVLLILPALWAPVSPLPPAPVAGGLAASATQLSGHYRPMSRDIRYYFVVWVLLVLCAAMMARGLVRPGDDDGDED